MVWLGGAGSTACTASALPPALPPALPLLRTPFTRHPIRGVCAAHGVFLWALWPCLSCLRVGLCPEIACDLRISCPLGALLKVIVIRLPETANPLVRAFLPPYVGKTCQGVLRHIHDLGKRRNHPEKVTHLTKPSDLHF